MMVAIILIASVSVFSQDNGTSAEWGYTPSKSNESAQKTGQTFTSDDTLYSAQLGDREYYKRYKDNYQFKFIKLIDGTVLGVGDYVTFGKPVGGNRVAQVNTGIGSSNVSTTGAYSTMVSGRLGLSVMSGMQWLPATLEGTKLPILEIKRGRIILGKDVAVATVLYSIETSFEKGELINPKRPMNRTEAIAKLKESKDLLDLGMMKQEDYDKLKSQLASIISQNK